MTGVEQRRRSGLNSVAHQHVSLPVVAVAVAFIIPPTSSMQKKISFSFFSQKDLPNFVGQ